MGRLGPGASLGVLVAGWLIGMLALNGVFTRSCGTYGFDCLGYGALIIGCASLIGSFIALRALAENGWRGWLHWIAIVASGMPAIAFVVGGIVLVGLLTH